MTLPEALAEVERLQKLVAELHQGVCAGYSATLDKLRAAERKIEGLESLLKARGGG